MLENEKKTLVLQKDKTFLVNKETFTNPVHIFFQIDSKGLCQFVNIVDFTYIIFKLKDLVFAVNLEGISNMDS